ncbi:YajG family lipoprotein [Marinobacterium jannaschii]|uniref:YajG family lipoprotein n=1 Tax=Marinobacterium jannaschii TaxID=64970 RepID=UPI0004822442|nr:YajG family lipoprotein [Marinobacterium jannaschii]
MLKRTLPLALTAAILSGCSGLPSQQLELSPQITTTHQLPNDTQILVDTFDNRDSQILGFRIDRLNNKAPISLANAESVIRVAAENALKKMGAANFTTGEFDMTIFIDEMKYEARIEKLIQHIDLAIKLRVKIEKYDKHYVGSYGTTQQHQFVSTPTPEDNKEIVEALLNQTLDRAFSDPRLLEFIQAN